MKQTTDIPVIRVQKILLFIHLDLFMKENNLSITRNLEQHLSKKENATGEMWLANSLQNDWS